MGLNLNPHQTRYAAFVIALAAFVVILFLTAPLIWSVLQIFIIATLVTLVLDVPVHWQVARRVPRWAATANLFILLLVIIIAVVSFLLPPLIAQAQQFLGEVPTLWHGINKQLATATHRYPQIAKALDVNRVLTGIVMGAGSWAAAARSVFATTIGAVTSSVLIVIIVLQMLLNPRPLLYGIRGLFPTSWWGTLDHIAQQVALRVRAWAIGILLLSLIIGVLDYTALWLINRFSGPDIPFILFFAILGGLLEGIPVVGPIIAAVLPALVGFSIDPILGLLVLGAFLIIQQLEGDLIAPYVFHRAVELHPVSLLFTLVVLSGLFGVFGAVIAVPVCATFKVLYTEWYYPLVHDDGHPGLPPDEPLAEEVPRTVRHRRGRPSS